MAKPAMVVELEHAAATEEALERDAYFIEHILNGMADESMELTQLCCTEVCREVELRSSISDRLRDKAIAWAMMKAGRKGQEMSDALGGLMPSEVFGLLLGLDELNG